MAVGWPKGYDMASKYVQVQIRVGKAWIPAHEGMVSIERGYDMRAAYKEQGKQVRLIPEKQVMAR